MAAKSEAAHRPAPQQRTGVERNVWFPLNPNVLSHCWTLYLSDPTVNACRGVVINELLSMGVMFADTSFARLSSEARTARALPTVRRG